MAVKLGNGNWAVKEDKLLAYNDNSGLFFNKEFDFSRGTSATYVAKDGLIKTAGIQPNIVNNGDFSELGSELVTNGDFDTDSDWIKNAGWSISGGVAVGNLTTNSYGGLKQSPTLIVGAIYRYEFTISSYTSGAVRFAIGATDSGTNISGNGLHSGYITYTAPHSSGSTIAIFAWGNFVGSIDNVSVKQVGQNWSFGGEAIIDNGLVSFVSASNTYSYIRQDVSSLAASLYKISIEVKNYVSGAVQVGFQGSSPNLQNLNVSADGVYTVELSPNANGDDLEISREFAGGAFDFDVDNVTVQEIQTDTPRIDFTNDTKGHLLLEPSRTNLVTNSNDFSSYTFTNIDYNANNSISPDGSVNATKVTPNTSNAFHDLRTSANISLGSGNNTVSFFIKSNGYNFFELGVASNSGFSKYATAVINLNDGTNANTGVNQTWTITNVNISEFNSDWYRLELTFNVDTSTSTAMVFASSLPTSTRGVAFQGDGTSGAYIYGLQLEQGSYPTSLINTTGAASTRNADVCNNSGSAQDFNDSEGVLYAEIAALADDLTFRAISISSDAGYNNSIMIRYISTSNQVNVITRIGSAINNKSVDVNDITEFNKIAFKYKSEDCALFINGVQVATSAGAFNSSGINNLSFNRGGGGTPFYGKVRNVQVFTEALTDEQLEKLTS